MSKITPLQVYTNPILLHGHSEGWIYRISDNYVVKVAARERYKKDMFHEIKIARLLYSFGISVPEPIICDFVNVRDIVEIGYIMEYIDGITNEPSTRQQANDEVNKADKLGFSRVKNIDGNYVDNPEWIFTKDKKIKLIDFTKWQYKDIKCQY